MIWAEILIHDRICTTNNGGIFSDVVSKTLFWLVLYFGESVQVCASESCFWWGLGHCANEIKFQQMIENIW